MTEANEANPATSSAGRRAKTILTPSQKYEIWLQLVRQEVTIAEAAIAHRVDRSTIMRIRTVAKEGALAALAASKSGTAAKARDYELEAAKTENARLSEALKEMAVRLTLVEGKGRWG
jgi:transposase